MNCLFQGSSVARANHSQQYLSVPQNGARLFSGSAEPHSVLAPQTAVKKEPTAGLNLALVEYMKNGA
jgi:hypothetical protein